ncbi:hypothetical protein V6N13_107824 [Hibiscus sabdariffa]
MGPTLRAADDGEGMPKVDRSSSWIWKGIVLILSYDFDPFVAHLRCVLGDETLIDFWSDLWVEDAPLKLSFP